MLQILTGKPPCVVNISGLLSKTKQHPLATVHSSCNSFSFRGREITWEGKDFFSLADIAPPSGLASPWTISSWYYLRTNISLCNLDLLFFSFSHISFLFCVTFLKIISPLVGISFFHWFLYKLLWEHFCLKSRIKKML